ncbi:Arylsulfatase [Alienimonas californiensis]|uniref:Arylsulfatase n=1 Tax=Alienimonas californiensis TaxID=2527989 RepID=A0A517PB96_9PLAN|nr:Arylsulfatase [Alienimonas californiensis]
MRPTSLVQALSLILLAPWTAVAAEPPPNVVLIFADDLGFGDLGCYGATKVRTPHIDRLAAEGRRFSDAHSVSAVCTPSRYGLLTGHTRCGRTTAGACGDRRPSTRRCWSSRTR